MTPLISPDPSRPLPGATATPRPVALLTAMAAVNVSLLLAGARARGRSALARLRPVIGHRGFRVAAALGLVLMAAGAGAHHLYLDRTGVPDLEPFIRFEPPTIGEVSDARGEVLIELAREYRRILEYDEIPPVVREAILAAEDKNFFSHSGIDYGAFPRVVWKTLATSASASWRHSAAEHRLAPSVIFPQG
ncbi:MAG TPA: transglycosylase domain-containing protein, partial [Vicinamibacteria bacterium]|nr:transglycosylase domain-containing protein [Vicinamibacteria bacterium]